MATTKVSKDGNFLIIETDLETTYGNAQWYDLVFRPNTAILRYNSYNPVKEYAISFNDFQDGAGTPINTKEGIVAYLKDLIG